MVFPSGVPQPAGNQPHEGQKAVYGVVESQEEHRQPDAHYRHHAQDTVGAHATRDGTGIPVILQAVATPLGADDTRALASSSMSCGTSSARS